MFKINDYEIYNTGEFNDEEYIDVKKDKRISISAHGKSEMQGHYPIDQNSPIKIQKIETLYEKNAPLYEPIIWVYYENTKPIAVKRKIKNKILKNKCFGIDVVELTDEEYETLYDNYQKNNPKEKIKIK